jgi:tetratricopeptide (TPR) repeat protein
MIKRFIFFLLFFCLSANAQNRDSDIKFRLAQSYERSNNFESAVKIYEELYTKDSSNVVLLEALRRVYIQLKRYDDAIYLLQARLGKTPNDITLFAQIGSLYARKSDEQKSKEIWDQAITIEPNQEGTYRIIASAMIENRLFDRAIETYQRGRTECGNTSLFIMDLAYLYSVMLNYSEATREYLNFVLNNPSQLAFVQSQMSQYISRADGLTAAIVVVEESIKKEINNLDFKRLLSWLYMEGKQFDKAYDVFKIIDEKTKANGQELYDFGERALKEKAYTIASKAFLNVVQHYPTFDRLPQARFGYARTLEESNYENDTLNLFGNKLSFSTKEQSETQSKSTQAQAITSYEQIVNDYRQSDVAAKSLYRIAIIKYEQFFDLDGARTALETIEKNYRMFPLIHADGILLLGDIYIALGELDKSKNQYESFLNLRPEFAAYKEKASLRLAELDYFNGNFQDAITKLRTIAQNPLSSVTNDAIPLQIFIEENIKPSDALLKIFAQGDLLRRQQRYSEALLKFESIIQTDSTSELIDETLMNIGDVLAHLQKYPDAIITYERLIKGFPDALDLDRAFIKIGQIYEYALKIKEKAIDTYKLMLERFPNSIYAAEARKRIRELRGDNI